MAKDSCPRSPDIDDITASVWPVLVSLIAALHRVVWGRRQAVRPSPQHVGSGPHPLGLNITGKQYVAPQLLAHILVMHHLATVKIPAGRIGSTQDRSGRLSFAAASTTVGTAAAATDTPASRTQTALSATAAVAVYSSYSVGVVAALPIALGSSRKRKRSAAIAASGAGMPVDSPPRSDAAPALLASPGVAVSHAWAVCAAAAGGTAADAGAAAAGTGAPAPAQLRAHLNSAFESDAARASKRPRFRCRNCGHEATRTANRGRAQGQTSRGRSATTMRTQRSPPKMTSTCA